MTKGKRYDPQDKSDAVASFEGMGGTTEAAKEVAADYGVHYTTILDWAKANGQKPKPAKRKVSKRAVKAKKFSQNNYAVLLKRYFQERDAYIAHRDTAQGLKKELEEMLKEL